MLNQPLLAGGEGDPGQGECDRPCSGRGKLWSPPIPLPPCLTVGGALTQAQSAQMIGNAIQSNPAFLTLRKIEVRPAPGALWVQATTSALGLQCCVRSCNPFHRGCADGGLCVQFPHCCIRRRGHGAAHQVELLQVTETPLPTTGCSGDRQHHLGVGQQGVPERRQPAAEPGAWECAAPC
jgi:hypothetical protein